MKHCHNASYQNCKGAPQEDGEVTYRRGKHGFAHLPFLLRFPLPIPLRYLHPLCLGSITAKEIRVPFGLTNQRERRWEPLGAVYLYCYPFSVRVPLHHRGKRVKEKGARGRNQKREGRCESLGRALPSLLWCLPRTILLSFPVSEAEQSKKSPLVCISSNTHTLLIFLQDNIPREALFCDVSLKQRYASALFRRRNNTITHRITTARGHHKRTGRSLTAVQGRLRSSPLPLKVPPSDPPPLSPSPLFGFHHSNLSVFRCSIEGKESRKRGRGGEIPQNQTKKPLLIVVKSGFSSPIISYRES